MRVSSTSRPRSRPRSSRPALPAPAARAAEPLPAPPATTDCTLSLHREPTTGLSAEVIELLQRLDRRHRIGIERRQRAQQDFILVRKQRELRVLALGRGL